MGWDGPELIAVMGGAVARASNLVTVSKSGSCPRLSHVENLLPASSFCSVPSFSSCFSSSAGSTKSPQQQSSLPCAQIRLAFHPSLTLRQSSASQHRLTFSALSPPLPSCSCASFSASLADSHQLGGSLRLSALSSPPSSYSSFSATFAASLADSLPDSCQLGASLMSSRLAPAYSSFCGVTQLEGLRSRIRSGSRHHRGPKGILDRPGRNAEASVEARRSISSGLSDFWSCREGLAGGGGRKLGVRCMETDKNAQRIECYSSCPKAAAAAGDQPVSSSVLPPVPPNPAAINVKGTTISFCPRCGGATEEKIPVGEHEKRYVCTACGAVHYQNPKMVVGCLVDHEGKILLCRRNIEPSFGLWTLPAGYMEMGESAAEGAARETLEEACAQVQVLGLFAHIDIPLIGQSHIYFRAQLKDPHFAPGPESIECALFKLNEIPFDSLAFSSIRLALKMYIEDSEAGKMRVHHAVIDKRPGASPSDLKGFVVRDVLTS